MSYRVIGMHGLDDIWNPAVEAQALEAIKTTMWGPAWQSSRLIKGGLWAGSSTDPGSLGDAEISRGPNSNASQVRGDASFDFGRYDWNPANSFSPAYHQVQLFNILKNAGYSEDAARHAAAMTSLLSRHVGVREPFNTSKVQHAWGISSYSDFASNNYLDQIKRLIVGIRSYRSSEGNAGGSVDTQGTLHILIQKWDASRNRNVDAPGAVIAATNTLLMFVWENIIKPYLVRAGKPSDPRMEAARNIVGRVFVDLLKTGPTSAESDEETAWILSTEPPKTEAQFKDKVRGWRRYKLLVVDAAFQRALGRLPTQNERDQWADWMMLNPSATIDSLIPLITPPPPSGGGGGGGGAPKGTTTAGFNIDFLKSPWIWVGALLAGGWYYWTQVKHQSMAQIPYVGQYLGGRPKRRKR